MMNGVPISSEHVLIVTGTSTELRLWMSSSVEVSRATLIKLGRAVLCIRIPEMRLEAVWGLRIASRADSVRNVGNEA
jgi:hypothetical protein